MSVRPTPLMRLPLLAGLFTLTYLTYSILSPFLVPLAWAAVLVFVTWPLYRHLLRLCGHRENVAAGLMTALLMLLMVGPLAWLLVMLQAEVRIIYAHLSEFLLRDTLDLPEMVTSDYPWLASEIQRLWVLVHENPAILKDNLRGVVDVSFVQLKSLAGGIGKNIAKLLFTLLSAFFLYRDGPRIIAQLRSALAHTAPGHGERYLGAAANMTRAVVFGIVLTALAQGALAGIGYAVAGAPNPVFLAVVTALFALIPFGTPFAWGAVAIWLLVSGDTIAAVGLAIWGTAVVSSVDNIVRPLVISSATQISFLLVMFGVLGGLASFGMIGLFIGPVILAVVAAIWQEWLNKPVQEEELPEA